MEDKYSPLADLDLADDAISGDALVLDVAPGGTLTRSISCAGDGVVAGWIDWNINGRFEESEKNQVPSPTQQVRCNGTSATLTWVVDPSVFRTVKATYQATGPHQSFTLAENGSFTKTVTTGTYALSVAPAGPDPISGYTVGEWSCAETENSSYPLPNRRFASTFTPGTHTTAATVTIPQADHVTCTITHRPVPGELSWHRVDHHGHHLSGSEWRLTGPSHTPGVTVKDCRQAPCAAELRDTDAHPGVFTVKNLRWGEYTLLETRAPAGYVLDDAEKRVNVRAAVDAGTFVNHLHKPLVIPLTGGTASISYILGGGGLTLGAIVGAAALGNRGRYRG